MKKFLCMLLLPILSLMCLCGCGEDKTSNDLKILYESMVDIYIVDKENKFFGDKHNPNSISIAYTTEIENAIDNINATTDVQKRYNALGYQQQILNYIFAYYENNHEDFYRVMSSGDFPNTEMNALYLSLESLKSSLENFKNYYNSFIDATQNGISDVMEFNLTSYSYQLNKLIDSSFDFIYKFIAMYQNYGIEDFSDNTSKNLQIKVDKSYVDIAYIIYLENFKAFDYSVGSKGICDLSAIIDSTNEFNLIGDLKNIKQLSTLVQSNLNEEDINYEEVKDLVNNYLYAQEVFDQRIKNYKAIYNEEDMYTISQYRFDLVSGVSYNSYIDLLNNSKMAGIEMLRNFISNTYQKLVYTLSLVVE